jgi:hypothetical protein
MIPRYALPWVLLLLIILILLALLSVAGYDNWSEIAH